LLQNIGNTSDILILKSKSVSDLKFRHQNLLIILLLQRVNFIKCGEYSFGQKTVAILGTLIWPGTVHDVKGESGIGTRRCLQRWCSFSYMSGSAFYPHVENIRMTTLFH